MNRIERIIYFAYWPFTQCDVLRFGLPVLRENGFEVEVWDFTPALHPEVSKHANHSKRADDPGLLSIQNLADGWARIGALHPGNTLVLLPELLCYTLTAVRVCWALSQRRIPYGVVLQGNVPAEGSGMTVLKLLKGLCRSPTRLIRSVVMRCPAKLVGIHPARMMLLAMGEQGSFLKFPTGRDTEVIRIHSFDYDLYLEERMRPCPEHRRLAVFLDDYGPFHQDFTILGMTPYCKAEDYYRMVCRFFSYLENKLGFEVVIAAHPKSEYEVHPDYYQGRRVIKGRTIQLVREAQVTLSFYSTAINFAILFNRPVLLLTTDLHEAASGPRKCSRRLSQLLDKRPLNISKAANWDLQSELDVCLPRYEIYKRRYIKTPGTPDEPFWEVAAKKIRELHGARRCR